MGLAGCCVQLARLNAVAGERVTKASVCCLEIGAALFSSVFPMNKAVGVPVRAGKNKSLSAGSSARYCWAVPLCVNPLHKCRLLLSLQVQTLDAVEAGRLLSGKPANAAAAAGAGVAGGMPGTAAQQARQRQQQLQEWCVQLQLTVNAGDEEAPVKVTISAVQPPPASSSSASAAKKLGGSGATGSAGARGSTTSSVGRLPGMRRTFGASLGARTGFGAAAAAAAAGVAGPGGDGGAAGSGSSSISALLGGAWAQQPGPAAAEAEAAAKKGKKGPVKHVVWKDERELVAVRWFVKEDPPARVRRQRCGVLGKGAC